MKDLETQLPPNNTSAEKSLLGCMLRDNQIIAEVMGKVKPDDFYGYGNACVFESLISLADKGKKADIVTSAEWLLKKKKMDDVGGPSYLADLWDAAPSIGNYRHYTEIIRDYSHRRRLINASRDMAESAFDLGREVGEVLGDAERSVMAISELGAEGEAVDLQTALMETYQRLDARKGRGAGELNGIPTGFIDLDTLLCGFQNSELIIIGARPSCGKTAFGLAIARHVGVNEELPMLFVSLEQARVELAERLLCAQGRIDSHAMRRGHLSATDETDVIVAGETLSRAKIFIDDSPAQDMLRITANARRLKQRHDIRLIVIDYLQLVASNDRRASRQEQVGEVSRRLKQLARELKVPVIALAQVNRGVEDRVDKRPRLSDLRESGSIEQDADTVIMLHRPDQHDKSAPEGLVEVMVAKQRNGPTGEVRLMFMKKYMRFENHAMEHQYS